MVVAEFIVLVALAVAFASVCFTYAWVLTRRPQ
jgi:hypothetical protein